jgi:hypothetical protein
MPAHPDPLPQRPDIIDGRYVVEEWIASGEQKDVYRGRDPTLGRNVAIALAKVDRLEADLDDVTAWEVKILGELGHLQHVVNVFVADVQDGFAYIVSEYMEGGTLGELCDRSRADGQPLPLETILRLAGEVAAGLEEIHSQGIIHRDIQPRNIWLDRPAGTARLGDFDLAIRIDDPSSPLSDTLTTRAYMAPELATGATATERSDLYALGATMYELAIGEPPFSGTDDELERQHREAQPQPPSTIRPDLPQLLDELILQLLAKDPGERPASAAEVRVWLRTISRSDEPPVDLDVLIAAHEGPHIEFKQSFREPDELPKGVPPDQRDRVDRELQKTLEEECVVTVAGFLNADGGALLVGVRDNGSIAGIEADFTHMQPKRANQPKVDMWESYLRNALRADLGNAASAQVAVSFAERSAGHRCGRRVWPWHRRQLDQRQRLLRARRQLHPEAHPPRSCRLRTPALARLTRISRPVPGSAYGIRAGAASCRRNCSTGEHWPIGARVLRL